MLAAIRNRSLRFDPLESRLLLAVYVIDSSAEDAASSLVSAIEVAAANPGPDTIELRPGVIQLDASIDKLQIDHELTIRGVSPSEVTLRRLSSGGLVGVSLGGRLTIEGVTLSGQVESVVTNEGSLVLRDVTVLGGDSNQGGGIYNLATLNAIDLVVSDGAAREGGGLFNGGSADLTNTLFINNRSSIGGGVYNIGDLSLYQSLITQNHSLLQGGGIATAGEVEIIGSEITGNTAPIGAGIFVFGGIPGFDDTSAVARNIGQDMAIIEVGVAGTLLNPKVQSITPAAGFVGHEFTSTKISTFGLEASVTSPNVLNPIRTTVSAWRAGPTNRIDLGGSDFGGAVLYEAYGGYQLVIKPPSEADLAGDQFDWFQVEIIDVNSENGGRVQINAIDHPIVPHETISYSPPEGFVGTDVITVTARNANGDEVRGVIEVNVSDQIRANVQLEAIERGGGSINVDVTAVGVESLEVTSFELAVAYDPSIVEFSVAEIDSNYKLLSSATQVSRGPNGLHTIEISGVAGSSSSGRLASLRFTRIAEGNASIQSVVRPNFQLRLPGEILTPTVVQFSNRVYLSSDVNRDGSVTALDALSIINQLNADNSLMALGFDINGDDKVSALDALMVINQIDQTNAFSQEPQVAPVAFNIEDLNQVFASEEDWRRRLPFERSLF